MGRFELLAFFSLVLFLQCGEDLAKGMKDYANVAPVRVRRLIKFCSGVPYLPGYRKCCGTQIFDPKQAKCCHGVIRLKSYGRESKCCGKSIINGRKKKCCQNKAQSILFGRYTRCCGRKVYDSRKGICCNKRKYNSRTHFCCLNGRRACRKYRARKCISRATLSCGKSSYDPSTHICCDGRVTIRRYGDDTRCCGRAVFNIKTMICCNGWPCARRPQPKPRDLRNDTCLYPSPEEARRRMHCRYCVCPYCQAPGDEVDYADEQLKLSDTQKSRLHALHTPWGIPKGGAGNGGCVLTQLHYITGYSTYLHVPLWVAYRLTGKNARRYHHRENCYRRDIRLDNAQASNCTNYYHSGYDRGHLAPSADFNQNEEAALNSFVFSNMAPQFHDFNSGMWLEAESLTRDWAIRYSIVYVISGSIFDENNTGLRENDNDFDSWIKPDEPKTVAVPTHFYKIITRCNTGNLARKSGFPGCNGQLEAIAFVLPHEDPSKCQLKDPMQYLLDHVVTIREIELLTRVSFFGELSKEEQKRLKSYAPTDLWPSN